MNFSPAAIATLAVAALLPLAAAPAHASELRHPDGHDCVSGPEFAHLGDGDHPQSSQRRQALEKAWDVRPVGNRNEYWRPANPVRWYSLAYKFCASDKVIAVVYRVNGDAWQYAVQGAFEPYSPTADS